MMWQVWWGNEAAPVESAEFVTGEGEEGDDLRWIERVGLRHGSGDHWAGRGVRRAGVLRWMEVE